jgi:hypothetical protein
MNTFYRIAGKHIVNALIVVTLLGLIGCTCIFPGGRGGNNSGGNDRPHNGPHDGPHNEHR